MSYIKGSDANESECLSSQLRSVFHDPNMSGEKQPDTVPCRLRSALARFEMHLLWLNHQRRYSLDAYSNYEPFYL